VATLSYFIARFAHEFDALGLFADISESRFFIGIWIDVLKGELVVAVATLARGPELLELLAGLAQMVGLLVTRNAEVLRTGIATRAELTHVHRRFSDLFRRM
jgi:hypothetical protein